MPRPNKKIAPITTSTSAKRSKNEPVVPNHEVRWSDLNYNIIMDIFSHFFTTQRLKYRRVSSAWNSMLLHRLSTSTDVRLQYSDLKHWKTIIYPPARETRLAMRTRKVPLVTERTRRLIIDFANIPIEVDYRSRSTVFGLYRNDEFPLAAVGRCHPQICHVVFYRCCEPLGQLDSNRYWTTLYCFSGSMTDLPPNLPITLYDFSLHFEQGCYMFSIAERTLIRSWKMAWPKLSIKRESPIRDVLRQQSMAYWPYPPNQLTWLSSCLHMIPEIQIEESPLSRFLARNTAAVYTHMAGSTFLILHGRIYSKFTLAFIARFVTTFRQHLQLPAPPHPLLWQN